MSVPQEGHEVLNCGCGGVHLSEGGVSLRDSFVLGGKILRFGPVLDKVPVFCDVLVDI